MPQPPSELHEGQVTPKPGLEKRTPRLLSPDILAQADACQGGELGALLRREKLYEDQSPQWHRGMAAASTRSARVCLLPRRFYSACRDLSP